MTMLSLRLFSRNVTPQSTISVQRLHTSVRLFDSDSDSDKPRTKKPVNKMESNVKKPEGNSDSAKRLNFLLKKMIEEPKIKRTIDVAVNPRKSKLQKAEAESSVAIDESKPFEDKLVSAAKDVAVSLGGDVKLTESELLTKILSSKMEETSSATEIQEGEKKSQAPMNLSQLIEGMKIDRTKKDVAGMEGSRAGHVRRTIRKTNQQHDPQFTKPRQKFLKQTNYNIDQRVNLNSGAPMGIFSEDCKFDPDPNTPSLSTWDSLEKRELKLAVIHPPANYFQQMILWTDQGKIWKFPIDNEQGMEEEQNVHFMEHVFLDRHLEGWCPRKGPIRHFMELVCTGLSKNPYLTVQQKKDHILWFKDYFEKKQELLTELGVYQLEESGSKLKQVEA